MNGKRLFAIMGLLGLLVLLAPAVPAEDAKTEAQGAQTPTTPPTPEPSPAPAQPKTGFFGDHIALYVETQYGATSPSDINTTVISDLTRTSVGGLSFDAFQFGKAIVGWQLPNKRGEFILRFTGFKENGYSYHTTGNLSDVTGAGKAPLSPVLWWTLDVNDGQLLAVRTPPVWDPANDANGNNIPDPGEYQYVGADRTIATTVPSDLENRIQTLELMYRREFGGRRYSGRWGAGGRYFTYKGNVPWTAWLGGTKLNVFTDGLLLKPLVFNMDTSGTGPTGEAEFMMHFFRNRLQLYGLMRAAFLLQTIHSDSGQAYSFVFNDQSDTMTPAPFRLKESVSKSAWQTGGEAGVRVSVLNGLQLTLGYRIDSYQDTVLLPDRINVPTTSLQVKLGTTGVYATQNLVFQGWIAGAGFQF